MRTDNKSISDVLALNATSFLYPLFNGLTLGVNPK